MSNLQRDTLVARYGVNSDESYGAVIPPLHLSSTFAFQKFGQKGRYDYTRSGNPTRDQLAGALAVVEGGCGAVVTWLTAASTLSASSPCWMSAFFSDLMNAPFFCPVSLFM